MKKEWLSSVIMTADKSFTAVTKQINKNIIIGGKQIEQNSNTTFRV